MSVRTHIVLLSVWCVACGARTELDSVAVDAASIDAAIDVPHVHDATMDIAPEVSSPSPLCAAPDSGKPPNPCVAAIQATHVASGALCYVDTVIHTGDMGSLHYACDTQSTWAVADFANDVEFVGGIHDHVVDLCTGTTFPWSDGCTWASAQRITGDITTGQLSFTYEEQAIDGIHCAAPCSASGTLSVQ